MPACIPMVPPGQGYDAHDHGRLHQRAQGRAGGKARRVRNVLNARAPLRQQHDSEPPPPRVRRAYYDCRYGQLHLHNAIPPGGGFDELTPVICMHGAGETGRVFLPLLRLLAGCDRCMRWICPARANSDPAPGVTPAEAAVHAVGRFHRRHAHPARRLRRARRRRGRCPAPARAARWRRAARWCCSIRPLPRAPRGRSSC